MAFRRIVMGAALLCTAGCGGPGEQTAPAEPASVAAPSTAVAVAVPSTPVAVTAPGADLASLTGDTTRGQTVFNQCRACHTVEAGRNGIGPSLAGIVGREAGAVPAYAYSSANKNSHLRWDPQTIFTYLEAPARTVPGTKMGFALRDAQQRADVIAYLETLR